MKTKIKYLITGVMLNGQRFKLHTCNKGQALKVSLRRGSVWAINPNGHRQLINRIAG